LFSILRAANSSPATSIGVSLRQKQSGQQVSLLPASQRVHRGIVTGPFDAAVPGALAVGAVALFSPLASLCWLVADQIVQGEAVVRP